MMDCTARATIGVCYWASCSIGQPEGIATHFKKIASAGQVIAWYAQASVQGERVSPVALARSRDSDEQLCDTGG